MTDTFPVDVATFFFFLVSCISGFVRLLLIGAAK